VTSICDAKKYSSVPSWSKMGPMNSAFQNGVPSAL
jgi:hypothetical protein